MKIGLRGRVVTYDMSPHDVLISLAYHLLDIIFPLPPILGSTQGLACFDIVNFYFTFKTSIALI